MPKVDYGNITLHQRMRELAAERIAAALDIIQPYGAEALGDAELSAHREEIMREVAQARRYLEVVSTVKDFTLDDEGMENFFRGQAEKKEQLEAFQNDAGFRSFFERATARELLDLFGNQVGERWEPVSYDDFNDNYKSLQQKFQQQDQGVAENDPDQEYRNRIAGLDKEGVIEALHGELTNGASSALGNKYGWDVSDELDKLNWALYAFSVSSNPDADFEKLLGRTEELMGREMNDGMTIGGFLKEQKKLSDDFEFLMEQARFLMEQARVLDGRGAAPEKKEAPKQEEPKQEEPKQEEPKPEEPKQEELKQEEPKQEEPKPQEEELLTQEQIDAFDPYGVIDKLENEVHKVSAVMGKAHPDIWEKAENILGRLYSMPPQPTPDDRAGLSHDVSKLRDEVMGNEELRKLAEENKLFGPNFDKLMERHNRDIDEERKKQQEKEAEKKEEEKQEEKAGEEKAEEEKAEEKQEEKVEEEKVEEKQEEKVEEEKAEEKKKEKVEEEKAEEKKEEKAEEKKEEPKQEAPKPEEQPKQEQKEEEMAPLSQDEAAEEMNENLKKLRGLLSRLIGKDLADKARDLAEEFNHTTIAQAPTEEFIDACRHMNRFLNQKLKNGKSILEFAKERQDVGPSLEKAVQQARKIRSPRPEDIKETLSKDRYAKNVSEQLTGNNITAARWIEGYKAQLRDNLQEIRRQPDYPEAYVARIMAARELSNSVRGKASTLKTTMTAEDINERAAQLMSTDSFRIFAEKIRNKPEIKDKVEAIFAKKHSHGGELDDLFRDFLKKRPAGKLQNNDERLKRWMPTVKERIEALQQQAKKRMEGKHGEMADVSKEAYEINLLRSAASVRRGGKRLDNDIPYVTKGFQTPDLVEELDEQTSQHLSGFRKKFAEKGAKKHILSGHGGKMMESIDGKQNKPQKQDDGPKKGGPQAL